MFLKNWSSFYGDHEFDFTGDEKRNVTLIHSEGEGYGKTSITSAFQWAMSGKTHMYVQFKDTRHMIQREMMMFGQDDYDGSLLNFEAYDEKKWIMSVRLDFTINDRNYVLTRTHKVEGGNFLANSGVQKLLTLEEKSGFSKNWEGNEAQKIINSLMPEKLLKFFIVEGDFITKYTEVLFNDKNNDAMSEAVRDSIGVNAIQKLTKALEILKQRNHDELNTEIAAANTKANKANNARKITQSIRDLELEVAGLDIKIVDVEHYIKDTKGKLEAYHKVDEMFAREKGIKEDLKRSSEEIEKFNNEIIGQMKSLWRTVVTPEILVKQDEMKGSQEKINSNNEKIISIRNQLENGSVEQIHCRCCKQLLPTPIAKLSDEKIKSLKTDIRKRTGENLRLTKATRVIEEVKPIAISSIETNYLKKQFEGLKEEIVNKNDLESKLVGIKENLDEMGANSADEAYKELRSKLSDYEQEQTKLQKSKKWLTIGHGKEFEKQNNECLKVLRAKLANLAGAAKASKEAEELVTRYEAYDKNLKKMYNIFENAEKVYLDKQHEIVDKKMTQTFRKMTNLEQKRTHDRLTTTEGWGVKCWTVEGEKQPMTNPGTRRKATLAYLESLRERSGKQFPTIFDNAQTSLANKGKKELVKHFIEDGDKQTIFLTHSGGYSYDDLKENYGHSINRSYILNLLDSGKQSRTSMTKDIENYH